MSVVVFVEDWQHGCCGEPFAVGDRVTWPTTTDLYREGLATCLGAELAATVGAAVDRHSDDVVPLTGRVRSLQAAFCRYEEGAVDGRGPSTLHPVAGTTVLRHLDAAERGHEHDDELEWVGYVVELQVG